MKSLAQNVLQTIGAGDWTIDSVAPTFRRQLSKSVAYFDTEKSTSELCISHYRKLPIAALTVVAFRKFISVAHSTSDFAENFNQAFAVEDRPANLSNFETDLQIKIDEALKIIETSSADLMAMVNRNIFGFAYSANSSFRSASHPHFFGIIAIGKRIRELTNSETAISIVHEAAHQELFLLNLLDRLVNQPFDFHEVHSPLQGRMRPPIGRLHSMWALMRMVQFQQIIDADDDNLRTMLLQNIETFSDEELTPFAKQLVETARKQAS